jgi:hypothetical protein
MFLTHFSYFSRYFLTLVVLRNCYLLILSLRGSTSYMRPQNFGTARVVSRIKTISAILAKGFLCEPPLDKRKSYLSYSQKLSDRHFLA